jgi:GntR family transcriptional repressor for pyruvate dehydrogenase complex
MKPTEGVTAEIVVQHVRSLIERGELRPGDRLPPERELAVQLGVSRPSVRAGLRSLAAIGVLQTRHGAGTFITDGPPTLGSEPLSFLAALHGFTRDEMFEARRALEVGVAGLSAERASDDQIATIAEEVTGMFASLDDAQAFLIHDIRFHRAVAAASGNPILASLVEMVSALFYEQRKKTASNGRDLKQSAQAHRNIYHAIRAHDAKRARAARRAFWCRRRRRPRRADDRRARGSHPSPHSYALCPSRSDRPDGRRHRRHFRYRPCDRSCARRSRRRRGAHLQARRSGG